MTTGRTWALCFDGERPWTVNGERKLSPFARAGLVSRWRASFQALALVERVPALDAVRVTAWPLVRDRRWMQDTGGCFPAVKAAIDGLVDARVLVDDGPSVVRAVTFTAPVVGEIDGLMVVIEELVL